MIYYTPTGGIDKQPHGHGAFRVIGGEDAGLYFRHGDHLGSTSVLSDGAGLKVAGSSVLYAPFGEIRQGEQSELTDFGYTGQRLDGGTGGLMYYGARYYLPELRRFISADTIVPSPTNPQEFNRFSYVSNNPIILVDPSGHTSCGDPLGVEPCAEDYRLTSIDWSDFVVFGDNVSNDTQLAVYLSLDMVYLATDGSRSPEETIDMVSGGNPVLNILWREGDYRGGEYIDGTIFLFAAEKLGSSGYLTPQGIQTIIHEFGHGVDQWLGNELGNGPVTNNNVENWFSNKQWPKLVNGWSKKTGIWTYIGCDDYGTGCGASNNYLPNPQEEFASTFSSVVINQIYRRNPVSVNGYDLSGIIRTGDINGDGVFGTNEVGIPDIQREQTVITILQNRNLIFTPRPGIPKNTTSRVGFAID